MDYKHSEKENYKGAKVKVLGETYESGMPDSPGAGEDLGWRGNMPTREAKLQYIKTGERYWYSDDWFGSDKRK